MNVKLNQIVYGCLGLAFGVSSAAFLTLARMGDDALADFGDDE